MLTIGRLTLEEIFRYAHNEGLRPYEYWKRMREATARPANRTSFTIADIVNRDGTSTVTFTRSGCFYQSVVTHVDEAGGWITGDTLRVETHAAVRRVGEGLYEVHANAPLRLRLPEAVQAIRDARGERILPVADAGSEISIGLDALAPGGRVLLITGEAARRLAGKYVTKDEANP